MKTPSHIDAARVESIVRLLWGGGWQHVDTLVETGGRLTLVFDERPQFHSYTRIMPRKLKSMGVKSINQEAPWMPLKIKERFFRENTQ